MAGYKVCVYAICKNESQFVDRWIDSMGEADLVVVTDTGSTDDTVEKLKERGAVVFIDEVRPWRFDVARNLSMRHVPQDADICVCTDLDELFEKGWRNRLEDAWLPSAKQAKYVYNWSLKEDGTPYVQMHYAKVHARQGFVWRDPVHEWLCYQGTEPKVTVFVDGMVLNHYPDPSKSRGSYLPLLELGVAENPQSDRLRYYLGREYMYKGEWEKCIDTLKAYLKLPSATWNEERCAAMRWIAKAFHQMKNTREAYAWYFRAIAEAPNMRDAYVECAKMAYLISDWPMAFFMAEEALKIKERSKTYVNMGYSWDHTAHDLAAIACYRLDMFERAAEHAQEAYLLSPYDERLKSNLKLVREKLKAEDESQKARGAFS